METLKQNRITNIELDVSISQTGITDIKCVFNRIS
jgi:hypothetical protein